MSRRYDHVSISVTRVVAGSSCLLSRAVWAPRRNVRGSSEVRSLADRRRAEDARRSDTNGRSFQGNVERSGAGMQAIQKLNVSLHACMLAIQKQIVSSRAFAGKTRSRLQKPKTEALESARVKGCHTLSRFVKTISMVVSLHLCRRVTLNRL